MESKALSRPIALALMFMAVIWVSPFAWLISNAVDPFANGSLRIPQAIGIDNFIEAFSGNAGRQFLNSIYIAAGTATLTVVVAAAAAYPLSRMVIPGKDAFLWLLVLLRMLPSTGVIVPLYFSAVRPVVERDGTLIMVDDARMPLKPGEQPEMKMVRFRTLGCYPLTGAVESTASTLTEIIQEMLLARTSERQGRMIDHDQAGSMEQKKRQGYF